MILTAEVSGGSHGGRIFRSSDFAKNFVQTNLPFHPLTQMMYSLQNSDYLLALSTEVSIVEELVLLFHVFIGSKYTLLKESCRTCLYIGLLSSDFLRHELRIFCIFFQFGKGHDFHVLSVPDKYDI